MRGGIPVRMRPGPPSIYLVSAGFQQYPTLVSEGATVMNVARSTFVRRGYLLTALAVAVLLAASSGTAWAQTTVSFSTDNRAVPPEACCKRAQTYARLNTGEIP